MAIFVYRIVMLARLGMKDFTAQEPVSFADEQGLDAFARLRVSTPVTTFDNKNVLSRNPHQWYEQADGTGAITFLPNESSVQLSLGTVSGNKTIRQSIRYIPYIPSKSQLVTMTFLFGTAVADVARRVGYFDDRNGLFLEQSDTLYAVVRSYATGAAVDTKVAQANWNLDKLDGNGKSGITLDITTVQQLIIDFQWLGVGRVRFGFSIGGKIHYFHETSNSNSTSVVYMGTPTLPVRYEMEALANGAGATMKEICCAVSSEGGISPSGLDYSADMSWAEERAVTVRVPILAVRLLNTFNGGLNRKTLRFEDVGFFTRTNDCLFELYHVHDPSAITATWASIGNGSGMEYSTDITAVTGNPSHHVQSDHLPSGNGSAGNNDTINAALVKEHSFLSQNFDSTNSQMFVVYATARTGTANVASHITWSEFS